MSKDKENIINIDKNGDVKPFTKKYGRHPIDIGGNCFVLINIFKREPIPLEEVALMGDVDLANMEHNSDFYREQAKQFVEQLGGEDCIAFNKELIKELFRDILYWDERCNRLTLARSDYSKKDELQHSAKDLLKELKKIIA